MTFTLAFRNLFHDRIRLAVTLVGILFSIVLVAVQLGLYLGARNIIISMIDRADGDLWIMAYGTKNFEEAQPISAREKFAALSTPGVAKAIPLIASFTDWRKPTGGSTLVVLIGADAEDGGLSPWNVVEGDVSGLGARDAVIVDKSYLSDLGIKGVGDTAQIGASRVRVTGLTEGIRSFTVTPYVFTTLNRARNLLDMPADKITYVLVKLRAGRRRRGGAQRDQRKSVPDSEVLTKAEFRDAQPQPLAVRDRRRRGADRRRHPRPHRRHRDRGADALFEHQGPPQRVRHAARAGLVVGLHPQGDPGAGRAQRRARLRAGHDHRHDHRLPERAHGAADRHDAGARCPAARTDASACAPISALSAIGKVMRIDPAMVFNR